MMVGYSSNGLLAEVIATNARVMLDPARYAVRAAELVDLARRAGEPEALVVALRALAWTRHTALDNAGAVRLLNEGARLAARRGLDQRLGQLLVTRAIALEELGHYSAAQRDLQRAEPLVLPADRPELLLQRAILDHNVGKLASAVAGYRRVLSEPGCPPVIWVKAANNLSYAETQLGNPRAALYYLDRAATLAQGLGPQLVAVIANSWALSSFHAGMIAESLRRFEEAGRLYAEAGMPLGEHYLDYADALVDLRLLDEAVAVARLAAAEFDRHGARLMAAEARLRCARLALALGDIEPARLDAENAVQEFREQRRPAWVARATLAAVHVETAAAGHSPSTLRRLREAACTLQRHGLRADAVEAHLAAGRAALAARRPAPARTHLAAAGELARRQPILVRLRGRLALAILAGLDGPRNDVIRQARAGLADLSRHRAALSSVELRVLAAGHGAELGELGLRSLLRPPTAAPSRILAWLERTRAASLLTVQPGTPDGDEDIVAFRSIEHELRMARRERGEEPPDLLARQRALEARIRRRSWSHDPMAGQEAGVISAQELRSLLGEAWLVEFAVVDGRIHAVVVASQRTRLVELGPLSALRRETDALLFALRRLLRGGRHTTAAWTAAHDAVAALSQLLIRPLAVPADTPLVVVPSGSFHRVPWSPLHPGSIGVAPSATFWARSRRAAPSAANPRVALVAGPDLPGAAEEIQALRLIHPSSTALLPPHSTVEATAGLLQRADLAHLACHGRLRTDNPLFSALDLSDGPLTLHEILERGLAPHRMILAACDSGAERNYEGDEVLGFVSATMAHGTAGVVASCIPLPDGASIAVMTGLHQSIHRGRSLMAALHEARAGMAFDTPEGYVAWCGLTAYGAG
jgi:tetratricopeptide (TPR) repeat protein